MPNNAVLVEVIDIQSIAKRLERLLIEKRPEIPDSVDTVWIDFDKSDPVTAAIRWGGGRAKLGEVSGEVGPLAGSIEFELSLNWLEVLSQDPESAGLVGRDKDQLYLLPKSKDAQIWYQVNHRTATEALMFLAQLANAPQETLEVFGLSIPREHVSWGAPLILAAFCFNFFIHVRFLTKMGPDLRDAEYPWTPLMRGWAPILNTTCTLLLLPAWGLVSVRDLAQDASGKTPTAAAVLVALCATLVVANAYNESFNSIFRTTCLDRWLFGSLTEARVLIRQWLDEYNTVRPHGSLGGMNPEQYLRCWMDGNLDQQPETLTA